LKIVKIGKYVIPLWLMAVILVSGIGSGVLAYYVWRTLTIPLEVKEPIEILYYPSQLSLYPGETLEFNITMQNHASVNYSVVLDFQLNNTTYQTNHITFSNEFYTVTPGQQNLTAWLKVKSDAPPINASLTIGFRRTGQVSFFDDFISPTLNSKWSIIDPYGGSTFNLTSMPGYLTISTTSPPSRDLWQGVNFYSPRIIQPINGNFTVETKLWAIMNASVQTAGIVIWKDQNNYLRLERAYRYDYQEILFIGMINGTFSVISAEVSNPGAILHIPNINTTYLLLVRIGMTYSGYYSVDGLNWNFVANITMETDYSLSAGLFNINRYGPPEFTSTAFTVSFDYFTVSDGNDS